MTPEQLDLLKRLQPFFRGKMGDARRGDEHAFEVLPDDWRTEFHYEMDANFATHTELSRQIQGYNTLCIPKAIDWQNPERGLWGMISGDKTIGDGADCIVYSGDFGEVEAPDPFTALLKALAEQEGV